MDGQRTSASDTFFEDLEDETLDAPEVMLDDLWETGQIPDLGVFLSSPACQGLTIDDMTAVIRVDQRRRWLMGLGVPLDEYIRSFPRLKEDSEALFELIYQEFLVREELGDEPDPSEYAKKFPEYADRLWIQMEVRDVLKQESIRNPRFTAGYLPDIPGFELLSEIGRGGMGVVYSARQLYPSRTVALKVILDGRFASTNDRRRFQNEADAIAALDHPNIVQIHEMGEYDGLSYFSMRLLTGKNLTERHQEILGDWRKIARLVGLIADAIEHAHKRGILHRDLKPSNILLDETWEPYVGDFGLAKRRDSETEHTAAGAVVGSPGFMAPEQAAGDHLKITTGTDVYGIGAILYYLLTGRAPFQAESAAEAIFRVRDAQPELPSKLNPSIPRPLEIICLACLEKDPCRRYTSAQALADDLRLWLDDKPITARPTPPLHRVGLWIKRHPAMAVLSSLLLTTFLVGSITVTKLWIRAEKNGEIALDNLIKVRAEQAKLSLAYQELEKTNEELTLAREQETVAKNRAQSRFDLALKAMRDTLSGTEDDNMLYLPMVDETRKAVLTRIIGLYKKLEESLIDDPMPSARAQLADSLQRLGWMTAEVGTAESFDLSMAAFDRAIEIRRALREHAPEDLELGLNEVATINSRALSARRLGKHEVSLAAFREADAILETLQIYHPDNERILLARSWAIGNISAGLHGKGRIEEAIEGHRQVRSIREELVRRSPATPNHRFDLAWTIADIASIYRSIPGRFDEAIVLFEDSRDRIVELLNSQPNNLGFLERKVFIQYILSTLYRQSSRVPEMLIASEVAHRDATRLLELKPGSTKYQDMFAHSLDSLSAQQAHARKQGYGDQSGREKAEEAIEAYERLSYSHPEFPKFREGHATTLINASFLLRELGDPSAAEVTLRRAIEQFTILARGDETGKFRDRIANCQAMLALVLYDQAKLKEAQVILKEAEAGHRSAGTKDIYTTYNIACAYSVLSDNSRSDLTRNTYIQKTIQLLHEYVERGGNNADFVLEDADMKPMLANPDFQRIILDMRMPKDPFKREN